MIPTQKPAVIELNPHLREFISLQAHRIRHCARETARHIATIGEALFEVKKRLPHGQWLAWLEAEFQWSERHAQKCISAFEWLKSKASTCSDLPIDASALFLLARPSTPTEAKEQALELARRGTPITHKKAVEIVHTAASTAVRSPSLVKSRTPEQIAADKRKTALNFGRNDFISGIENLAGIQFSAQEIVDELIEHEELYGVDDERIDASISETASQLEVAIAFLLEARSVLRDYGLAKPAKFGAPTPMRVAPKKQQKSPRSEHGS